MFYDAKHTDHEGQELRGYCLEVALDAKTDPTPFQFKPYQLAHLLGSTCLATLEDIGGVSGLLQGLGTNPATGLLTTCTSTSTPSATFEDRKRVYGSNVIPLRKSETFFQFGCAALLENGLVSVLCLAPDLTFTFWLDSAFDCRRI